MIGGHVTIINLPTNSTVARLLAPIDPILIAWSTTTPVVSSPTHPTLFTNDHKVGNSAEYAASVRGRDNPSAAFAWPANKRETYSLTLSAGSEAIKFDFWEAFSFDLLFRERGLDGTGSAWCIVKREVSSQKTRLSAWSVCSTCRAGSQPISCATPTQAYLDISLTRIGGEREVDRHVTKQDTQFV